MAIEEHAEEVFFREEDAQGVDSRQVEELANSEMREMMGDIRFDIAVTVSNTTGKEGKAGLTVLGIGAGAEGLKRS